MRPDREAAAQVVVREAGAIAGIPAGLVGNHSSLLDFFRLALNVGGFHNDHREEVRTEETRRLFVWPETLKSSPLNVIAPTGFSHRSLGHLV